jgi:hypothetical protein
LPGWLTYTPLVPIFLTLAARHRLGLRALFTLNPALKYGCAVIESKFARYRLFAGDPAMVPTIKVRGRSAGRLRALAERLHAANVAFPVVVKPDLGHRSRGVARANDLAQLVSCLSRRHYDCLVQPYVDLPCEFSVYYYRIPATPHGEVLAVTERVLPRVIGDGQSSIADLIADRREWAHITAQVQRHSQCGPLDRVPRAGEIVPLRIAASSRQGVLFVDRRYLGTPALRARLDDLCAGKQFFVGKFDLKVSSPRDLAAGRSLQIFEVNGPLSGLNYTRDPRCSYSAALGAVAQQLRVIFTVAASNRGCSGPSLPQIVAQSWRFARSARQIRE